MEPLEFPVKIFLRLLIKICLSLVLFACTSSQPAASLQEVPRTHKAKSVQDAVVNYLALPDFAHKDFQNQVLGSQFKAIRYDRKKGLLYFTCPRDRFEASSLLKICLDTSQVELGSVYQKRMRLAPLSLRDTSLQLLRFPRAQLKVDSSLTLHKTYGGIRFQLDLMELRDFYSARSLFNSPALTVTSISPKGVQRVIANHSAPIARKGSSALQHLVTQISDTSSSVETIAQDLLNFVTREIEYKDHGKYEIFMKPHEVLLSGETDCSGKVVLYSSLLNQVDIPHLLVYMKGHIALAVKGQFRKDNKMYFQHNGEDYFIAETTLPGFHIGISSFRPMITWESIQYLQFPGEETRLYDIHKEDSLDFALGYISIDE